MQLPEYPESYWRRTAELPAFPKLTSDLETEFAVVGGGLTGLTTAYLLAKEGRRVALLTAGRLLGGTTGYTTAKITAQHDLIYDELISHFGEDKARLYYEANAGALEFMRGLVAEHGIACDFVDEDAVVYATREEGLHKLDKEYAAYQRLGIPGERYDTLTLPFGATAALSMQRQARFHPTPYAAFLASEIVRLGGEIFEETTMDKFHDGDPAKVTTKDGYTVTCEAVAACSHFPFFDNGFYFARLHAESSYVIAIKSPYDYPGGMYITANEPKRSVREVTYGGEKLLLIGGESHKTGQGECTIAHYEALKRFAEDTFGVEEIRYRWSTHDLVTLDKMPYIGLAREGTPNLLVATGYRKWGMTTSAVAGRLLSDLLIGRDNPYAELFGPSRFQADPDIGTLAKETADVAYHFVKGKLEWLKKDPEELGLDEGAAVRIHGRRCGAYRDHEGKLHVVDTTCTHMGCETEWNAGDRTWDCPCHGSRFTFDGEVMHGPAKKPLERL
ncbi:FAD-dependent oxidoreductase [Cohnella sp. GbtcB17]|uniref:FAD-dependent oxidoreductase n=1 Tax=Cohnella sp. GbtcB17 TaxID=2824762 RepID=UPI001C2F9C14|nr:FAD-dependent oxidoreductase [Cohnella sp. GbtcB17]